MKNEKKFKNEGYLVKKKERNSKNVILNLCLMFGVILFCGTVFLSYKSADKKAEDFSLRTASAETGSPTPDTTTPTLTLTPTPGTQVIVRLHYANATIQVLQGTGGSNKLYVSTDKMKNWNLIESPGGFLDLNAYMKTSDTFVYFRGNKDIAPVEIKIPAQDKSLKGKYEVLNGVGVIVLEGAVGELEYRRDKDENWSYFPSDTSTFSTAMYEMTGVTLQIRKKATETIRAGKPISVKIPKRSSAPSVKMDNSKLVLSGLKPGQTEYRVGETMTWTLFNPTADPKAKTLDLYTLLRPGIPSGAAPLPATMIEVRTAATDKKPASGIRTIEIPSQRSAPGDTVKLEGTTLTITDASSANPYEYTMLKTTETMDLADARWKSVTNTKPIIIKKTGNADTIPGDRIYIRYKYYKDKETKKDVPASLYKELKIMTVTQPIK